jgi:hypothetical protein
VNPLDGLAGRGGLSPRPTPDKGTIGAADDRGGKGIDGLVGVTFTGLGADAFAVLLLGATALRLLVLRLVVLRADVLAVLRAVVFALAFLAVDFFGAALRAAILRAGFLALRAPALRFGAAFFCPVRFTLLRADDFLLVVRFFPLFFVAMALLRS